MESPTNEHRQVPLSTSQLDFPPHLDWLDPPEELNAARHIQHLLGLLWLLVDDWYASALDVFVSCDVPAIARPDRRQAARWKQVAARDAAVTVYHVASTIGSIRGGFRDCPTLRSRVDHATIRDAAGAFDRRFPQGRKARHANTHFADFLRSYQEAERHKPRNGPDNRGVLIGNRLLTSLECEATTAELSLAALEQLRIIKHQIFGAFDGATVDRAK